MSTNQKTTSNLNNPVSVTIGTQTYTNIASWAERIISTDGGAMEVPRDTPGDLCPHGVTSKPRYMEIIIGFDNTEIKQFLISEGYLSVGNSGSFGNKRITTLRFVERNSTKDRIRTVTYGPNSGEDSCVVTNISHKYMWGKENPIVEVTLSFVGGITFGAWSATTT